MKPRNSFWCGLALVFSVPSLSLPARCAEDVSSVRRIANAWRAEHRTIDLHQHIDYTEEHLARAVRIMDAVGLGIGVNLSGGVVTRKGDTPSEFERNKALA